MWFKINSVNGHIWSLDVTKDKDLRRRLVQFYVSVSRWGLNLYTILRHVVCKLVFLQERRADPVGRAKMLLKKPRMSDKPNVGVSPDSYADKLLTSFTL